MTQIIKKQTFEVDGHRFNSEKEAQDYIKQRDEKDAVLKYNSALLTENKAEYVPIYDPEEESIDIFVLKRNKSGGNWDEWQSLVKDQELRYYDEKLVILTPDEFMGKFREYPSFYIGTNEWNAFLGGITYINEKCKNPLDWKEVIGLIGQMQVTPEHIYSD